MASHEKLLTRSCFLLLAVFLWWLLLPPYIQDWQQGKQHAKSTQFQKIDCGYSNQSNKQRYICLSLPEAGVSVVEDRKFLMKIYDNIDYVEVVYYRNTRIIDSFGVVLKEGEK